MIHQLVNPKVDGHTNRNRLTNVKIITFSLSKEYHTQKQTGNHQNKACAVQ